MVWLRMREMVEWWGVGLQGDNGRENQCGWDFIYIGEDEGQLVVRPSSAISTSNPS